MLSLYTCTVNTLLNCWKKTTYFSYISTIWENKHGCDEKQTCNTTLYLLSVLVHGYNITIDCGVGSPVHIIEVVDFLNTKEKGFSPC